MVDVSPQPPTGFPYTSQVLVVQPPDAERVTTTPTGVANSVTRFSPELIRILPINNDDHSSSDLPLEVLRATGPADSTTTLDHSQSGRDAPKQRSRYHGTPVATPSSKLPGPRSVFYNGPIQDGEGRICRTDRDLSAAMLATRKFWFQPPPRYDADWAEYLEQYKTQTQTWPRVLPPGEEDFIKSILASNDSAPGPDGIPYAAWRIYPRPAAIAMITHLL